MSRPLSLLLLTVSLVCAADGPSVQPVTGVPPPGAPSTPGPMPMGGQRPMMGPMPGRSGVGFEVEVLHLALHDLAAVARWAELAAAGYHLAAAIPAGDGATVLYLERSHVGAGPWQLPDEIARDGAAADALRARIQTALAERQQAMMPPHLPVPPQPPMAGAPPATPLAPPPPAPVAPPPAPPAK